MKLLYWSICLLFFISCKQEEETIQPVRQNITESVYASGKVKSKNQYEVYPATSGIIKQINVTDGSNVAKGDVLMVLVHDALALQTENASLSANYQSLQANIDRINEADINISLAKIKLQNDSSLLQRQRNLWSNGIGSRNELEQKELAVKNSAIAYQTLVLRYKQLKKQLEFSASQSQKILQVSKVQNDDYNIRAKYDGKVYTVTREAGEMVTPQIPVAIVGSADEFVLELQVDEYDISKIRMGQKLFVSMDSYKGEIFEAVVTKIEPFMKEKSRSVSIEAAFTKQPTNLLPNLTAEANVLIRTKENALTIPRSFLVDENYVLMENDEKRKVVVGLKDYHYAEIINGLSADDRIKKPNE